MIKFDIGIPDSTKAHLFDMAAHNHPPTLQPKLGKIAEELKKLDNSLWSYDSDRTTSSVKMTEELNTVFCDLFAALVQAKKQSPGDSQQALEALATAEIQHRNEPVKTGPSSGDYVQLLPELGRRLDFVWKQLSEKITNLAEALKENSVASLQAIFQSNFGGFDLRKFLDYLPRQGTDFDLLRALSLFEQDGPEIKVNQPANV